MVDTTEIFEWLGKEPSLARVISAARKLDKIESGSRPEIRFAILRDVTLEPGLPAALKVRAAEAGLRPSVYLGDFGNVQHDVYDSASALYASHPEVIVVALRLQALAPRLIVEFTSLGGPEAVALVATTLERVVSLVRAIRERSSAIVLVHAFELPATPAYGILDAQLPNGQLSTIRKLNAELAVHVAETSNAYVVDVDHLMGVLGYHNALDDRYWHIGRAPYSFAFVRCLAAEYVKFASALKGLGKKCLVLDCDNTLWGGVIGEDGLGGIKLGATYPGSAYVEFQAAIVDLYHRGVLLALDSKNNAGDALEVFQKHPNTLLRPEHFVAKRINWQDKATNLREIAAELNIGLDSLVFVDDNPFECRYVRETLPDVAVVELPADPTRYARLLRELPYFETLTLSDEDRRRSEMYRAESRRGELKAVSGSLDDYLRSLEMRLTVSRADAFSISRIAQLTQKTNQFNLTTRRYGEGDVRRMAGDSAWRVYFAELVDKFDDAGIIAAAIVDDRDGESRVDTLLMSCRVIGRGVECALLAAIADDTLTLGRTALLGEFLPTAKNALAKNFYPELGFKERFGSDGRWWHSGLPSARLTTPEWFSVPALRKVPA